MGLIANQSTRGINGSRCCPKATRLLHNHKDSTTGVPYIILALVNDTDRVHLENHSQEFRAMLEAYVRETVHRLSEGRKPFDVNIAALLSMVLSPSPFAATFWCMTGLRTIAITPEGQLHPCQMFVGHGMEMGNIVAEGMISPQLSAVQTALMTARKDRFAACNHCIGKWACTVCTGAVYRERGTLLPQTAWHCGTHRAMVRAALLEASRLRGEAWTQFLANLTRVVTADIAVDDDGQ